MLLFKWKYEEVACVAAVPARKAFSASWPREIEAGAEKQNEAGVVSSTFSFNFFAIAPVFERSE